MQSILYNISQVLGISIIHSLWQGMLVYFVLRIVFAAAPSLSSVRKYNLAIIAIASVTVFFIYTLFAEINGYNWVALKPLQPTQLLPSFNFPANPHIRYSFYDRIAGYMPYICTIYIVGLLANVAKLGWEWNKIRRIKQSLICAEQMQQFINSFSKKLAITKHIQLKFSELVDVPCMIGFFKPLILLPVSLSVHLSACEVEAILLHELSHIKRNDYLINLLQQAISVMLFFNPFTRLINRIINQERENSCDDLVVEKTGKPLIYAQALLKLEQARAHDLQLALAVTGKKFHLLTRIERIMKTQKQIGNVRHLFIAIFLFAGALGSIAWFNPSYAKSASSKILKHKPVNNSSLTLSPDTDEYFGLSDTIKHKHLNKAVVINKIADKKHLKKQLYKRRNDADSSFSDSLAGFYDNKEWKAQMQAMRKKFDSPEWKNQVLAMQLQGEEMRKKFNSPEWKKQVEDWKKQGEDMRKQFDNPEWKKQMEDMRKQGEDMKKKFNSPEWKQQMEDWKKQREDIRKQFDNPEWKKQMEDMRKQGEDMRKKFNSAEWKEQTKEWKKQAEQFKKQFNSTEWKRQTEDWKKQAEQFKKQFNNPEWKRQMDELKKQRGEWKKAWKDQKWILKDSVGGVKIYAPKKDSL